MGTSAVSRSEMPDNYRRTFYGFIKAVFKGIPGAPGLPACFVIYENGIIFGT
jgi:hypothetical protein